MHIQKKTTISGEWAKKGEDVKDGDSIIVLDEGEIVTGDFGDSHVFKVKTDKGDKLLRFNQTSLNNMVDAFDNDVGDKEIRDVRLILNHSKWNEIQKTSMDFLEMLEKEIENE